MYEELIEELRTTERICRDRMDGDVMLRAADVIERLKDINEHYENIINKHERINGDLLEKAKALQSEVEELKAAEDLDSKLNLWRQDKISRWIPVTERLPEPGALCLCWCKGGTFGQIRWYGLYYLTSHRTWAIYDNDYENQEVTHWMYRPEPPKEV